MKTSLTLAGTLAFGLFLAGCATPLPPGAERGPDGTMAYDVLLEASEPGARIEANGEIVGNTPLHLKIYGDPDGTFHDFGSDFYLIRALPMTTNQFAQTRLFGTGRWFGPEDAIPKQIHFDMNQPPPPQPPVYVYPGYYGPPYYYPYYYYPYYGPSVGFYFGGSSYYHHGYHNGHYHGSSGLYYQRR